MGLGSAGGAFIPGGDYDFGNVTVSGTLTDTGSAIASPVISGTVTGGASYTAPTLTAPTITGALTGTVSGSLSIDNTLTAASYAPSTHVDELYSKITLTPSTTVTAANGLNAIRGEVNLTTGKTLGSGAASYVTGVYGRGNIAGTVDIGSGDLAAVYAKFDLNGSTLTSGHIAPLQSNIVNPGATAAATTDLIYGESASGTKIKSGLSLIMAANYLMDLEEVGTQNVWITTTAAGSAANKWLRIRANGTAYKIALLDDA